MFDYKKSFYLKNKIAVVVGGLGLIGKEISIALSSAGAKTYVLDINELLGKKFEKSMLKKNHNVSFFKFDISKTSTLEKNFINFANKLNGIDIFVNCSYPKTSNWNNDSFKNIKFNTMQKHIDIHMNSFAWLAKTVAELMVKQKKSGSIIQLGSIYGVVGQDLEIYKGSNIKENMSYSLIKGGIISLTRLMASYYGKYNIRINTLCPGGVEEKNKKYKINQKKFINKYKAKVPLKRFCKPSEVATCALFLATEASSYVTGTTIMVDGGWTAI